MREGERLSEEINEALKRELEPGESPVWWGLSVKDKYCGYFITERRLIVIKGPIDFEIRSYYPRDICNVRRGEGDRANDVIFARTATSVYEGNVRHEDVYLADVDDPERAREELQALADKYVIETGPPSETVDSPKKTHVHPKRFANLSCLSDKTRTWIESELAQGERILWFDKPYPRLFSDGALGAFFFGILLCGLIILVGWIMTRDGATDFASYTKIAFLAFSAGGCYLMLVPPLNYWDFKRFIYVLTNQRFLVYYSRGKKVSARSYDLMDRVFRKERTNGTGDVLLEWGNSAMLSAAREPASVGLESIYNPKEVEGLLRTLIHKPQERELTPSALFGLGVLQNSSTFAPARKSFSFSRVLGLMSWLGTALAIFGAMYGMIFMSPIFMKATADYFQKQPLYQHESLMMIYSGIALLGLALLLVILRGIVNIYKAKPEDNVSKNGKH